MWVQNRRQGGILKPSPARADPRAGATTFYFQRGGTGAAGRLQRDGARTDVLNLCWRCWRGSGSGDAAEHSASSESIRKRCRLQGLLRRRNRDRARKHHATRPEWAAICGWGTPVARHEDQGSTASLRCFLGAIRTRFEFSIVVGPCAAESTAVTAMAQQADGIVLVLSAHAPRLRHEKSRKSWERRKRIF